MEYEIENLMKLRNLENTLSDLLKKIDKEIIQTDVEWLHLKNIATSATTSEGYAAATEYPFQNKKFLDLEVPVQKSDIGLGNIKKETSDEMAINSLTLNLNSFKHNFNQGTDEEFDSD